MFCIVTFWYTFIINFHNIWISDFGMMGEFKEEFRDGFIEACLHLINRDYDELAKDFVTLGYIFIFPTFAFSNYLWLLSGMIFL